MKQQRPKILRMLSFTLMLLFNIEQQFAAEIASLSLSEVLAQMEKNHPSLQAQRENLKAVQAMTEGVNAWMPPEFSVGVMRFPYRLSMLGERNNAMNQAGLTFAAQQMLPDKWKNQTRKSYLESLTESEVQSIHWNLNKMRKEVSIQYYKKYIAMRKQKVLNDLSKLLNDFIVLQSELVSNKNIEPAAMLLARAKRAETDNMKLMLIADEAEATIALNVMMGRNPADTFLTDSLIRPDDIAVVSISEPANRSDLKQMDNMVRSMKLEQQILKNTGRPQWGLRGEHMQMLGMRNQWSLMGMVTLPLAPWSSGMRNSEVLAMNYKIRNMELQRETMKQMSVGMITEKTLMLHNARTQLMHFENEVIPAYKLNLQMAMKSFGSDSGSVNQLLDAWEMLKMKQSELYDILFRVLKLQAEYDFETANN